MFFIRAMLTRKWICFYAVRKVTNNVSSIAAVAELELQIFKNSNKDE